MYLSLPCHSCEIKLICFSILLESNNQITPYYLKVSDYGQSVQYLFSDTFLSIAGSVLIHSHSSALGFASYFITFSRVEITVSAPKHCRAGHPELLFALGMVCAIWFCLTRPSSIVKQKGQPLGKVYVRLTWNLMNQGYRYLL